MDRPSLLPALLALLVLSALQIPALAQGAGSPTLPGIAAGVEPTPVTNVGINKPAVVAPGDQFQLIFRGQAPQVSSAYAYAVRLSGGRLAVANYTLEVVSTSGNAVTLRVPQNVAGGLYDIVLVGQKTVELPGSLWVISGLPDVLRIVHVSDQHYGAGVSTLVQGDKNRFSGYLVAGLLGPDLVIDTGDLADTASSLQYAQAIGFERALLYGLPILGIPGNHDYPNDNYVAYLGDTRWYRVIGGKILVVGINTKEQGYPDWDDIVFLEGVLRNYSKVPIKFLLIHHPMFYYQGQLYTSSEDNATLKPYAPGVRTPVSSYWSGNMTAFFYVLRLIEDYNVTYVLAGHTHRDLWVEYHSTRTNTTTYFIDITTLSMGSAIYDGLDVYRLDTGTGSISFPITPPTFIGFRNLSSNLAENSLPIGFYPGPNNLGQANISAVPAAMYQTNHAYVFEAYNNLSYLNLSNVVLWSLPWSGDKVIFTVLGSSGGASASLVDYLLLGGRLYVALNISLPYGGYLRFALANDVDADVPQVVIKNVVPQVPTLGAPLTIYMTIYDYGWGPANATFEYSAGPVSATLSSPATLATPFNSSTYKVVLRAPQGAGPTTAILNVVVRDFAGNAANVSIILTFYPSGASPTATPITISTVSSSTIPWTTASPTTTAAPTTTSASPTPTSTSPASTPSPTPTPAPTTAPATSATPAPTTSAASSPATTSSPPSAAAPSVSTAVVAAIAIVVVVAAVGALLALRRR
ncbi:MAG: metallophosphoesterase [Desulfurococcaceae archaeon]